MEYYRKHYLCALSQPSETHYSYVLNIHKLTQTLPCYNQLTARGSRERRRVLYQTYEIGFVLICSFTY